MKMYSFGILAAFIVSNLPCILGSIQYSRLEQPAMLTFRHNISMEQVSSILCQKDNVTVYTWNPSAGDGGTLSPDLAARAGAVHAEGSLTININSAREADDGFYHCQFNDTATGSDSDEFQLVTYTSASYVVSSYPPVSNNSNIIRHFMVEPVLVTFESSCSKPPVIFTLESRIGIFTSESKVCNGKLSYGRSVLKTKFNIKERTLVTTTIEHPFLNETPRTFEIQLRPQCEMQLCKNGATCIGTQEAYRCKCVEGFGGTHCEVKTGEGVPSGGMPIPTIIGICVGLVVAIILVGVIVLVVLHFKKGYAKYKARRKHATFGRYMRRKLPRSPSMKDEDRKPLRTPSMKDKDGKPIKYQKINEKEKEKKKSNGSKSHSRRPKDDQEKDKDGSPLLDGNENTRSGEVEKEKQRHRVEKSHSTRSQGDRPERPRRGGEGRDSSHRREGRDSSKGERKGEGRDSSRRVEGKESFRRDGKDPSRRGEGRESSGGRSEKRDRPHSDRREGKDRGRRAPSDAKDRRPREHRERRQPPDKEKKDKDNKENMEIKGPKTADSKSEPSASSKDASNVPGDDSTKHNVSGLKVL